MNLVNHIDFLNRAIASQRAARRFQIFLVSGMFCLGVAAIVLGHLLIPENLRENLKWLPTVGGIFPPALAGFPLKDIFARKDKIAALTFLRQEFESLQGSTTSPEDQQVQRLQQRFDQLIDKVLGQ